MPFGLIAGKRAPTFVATYRILMDRVAGLGPSGHGTLQKM
jgi:hypothetical protein